MKVKTCLYTNFTTECGRLREPVSVVQYVAWRGSRKAMYNRNYSLNREQLITVL
jgi:hypothetical protein